MTDHVTSGSYAVETEDKTLPTVSYGLYLLSFATLFTVFIGLFIAYSNRDMAGPKARSHYTFMINTFWMAIGLYVVGGIMTAVGAVLSLILIGIPALILGILILCGVSVWFAARCIVGLVYLSRDEAYPRPYALLI